MRAECNYKIGIECEVGVSGELPSAFTVLRPMVEEGHVPAFLAENEFTPLGFKTGTTDSCATFGTRLE